MPVVDPSCSPTDEWQVLTERDQDRLRDQQEKFAKSQVSYAPPSKFGRQNLTSIDVVQTSCDRDTPGVPDGLGFVEHDRMSSRTPTSSCDTNELVS